MADKIMHRVFARCQVCGRDIARWEDAEGWWHLDGWLPFDHVAAP